MAEEMNKNGNGTENQQDGQQSGTRNDGNQNTPSVEELMSQLAQVTAERDRQKNLNDKLSKSEAEMKRKLRATQTAEEQKKEEEAEAQRIAEEERDSLRKELNHIKAVAAYKNIRDEKTVELLIEAVSDDDHNAVASIMDKYAETRVKEEQAKWMKSRPPVNAGQYSSMTREQIMAISDRDERRRAMAQNMDLFR